MEEVEMEMCNKKNDEKTLREKDKEGMFVPLAHNVVYSVVYLQDNDG